MQTTFNSHGAGTRRSLGFTLMELMIVLVIVGILASVGYPAYVDYATRAKRKDGSTLLLDAAARMERYFYDNNRYSATLSDLGYGAGTIESADGFYTLGAAVGATGNINTSYLLTATPNAAKPFSDADCGNLTLDSRGTQNNSGPDSVNDCWGR